MNNIYVIADIPDHAYELISKAATIGGNVTVFVKGDRAVAEECFSFGAHRVKLMPRPGNTIWERYATSICSYVEQERPELILVGATRRGKTLAAYMAGLLDCPYISEAKKLEVNGNTITASRTIYGGLAEKSLEISGQTVIVSIAANTFDKVKVDMPANGEITEIMFSESKGLLLVAMKEKEVSSVNLNESDVVIGVGRGFGNKENLKLAEEVAELLGGELGCTRPVAEDLHWLPEERYIGISGAVIKPNLYLCAGISGQIQHVYGIRDAKMIVAIDKNENAPIFKVADYYIVGDLLEVLPEIISALKQA
ncbi:electron transfer flavoprotein subunit alpha/FixB family protein [Symbiobacterium thermophilum]|uniref:Electron transfer flavoprotein subunit alpha/FixB family protein n=1 Tax=Symbiobacterium thermophilum TaxID=2734 RepID=A0A953I7S9_SYMTR|nr:electron transfer flavoprotein subunit alpha/FixB family protein [Symbiobacterium thermophilum]MBY6276043.1 electron transfer flavoprotein subunit alpha/FixB family protein [Symbiobacterium thermophilum]